MPKDGGFIQVAAPANINTPQTPQIAQIFKNTVH